MPYAVPIAGLDSSLDNLLQRTSVKQRRTSEHGLRRDSTAGGGRIPVLGEGEGGLRAGGWGVRGVRTGAKGQAEGGQSQVGAQRQNKRKAGQGQA